MRGAGHVTVLTSVTITSPSLNADVPSQPYGSVVQGASQGGYDMRYIALITSAWGSRDALADPCPILDVAVAFRAEHGELAGLLVALADRAR